MSVIFPKGAHFFCFLKRMLESDRNLVAFFCVSEVNCVEEWDDHRHTRSPTDPFIILVLQIPSYDIPKVHRIPRSADLKALEM